MPTGVYIRTEYHKEINRLGHLGQVSYWKGKKRNPLSKEWKNNISKSLCGHLVNKETRKKIGLANTGRISVLRGIPRSDEVKLKISLKNKGRIFSEKTKEKMSLIKKGKHLSPSTEFKKGAKAPITAFKRNDPRLVGERNILWKGGITSINNQIRGSYEYKLWEKNILKLNNHCKKCGEIKISKLVAHHILNFSNHPELRFDVNNGITLCKSCHKEFHHKYGKKNNTREQVDEFFKQDKTIV